MNWKTAVKIALVGILALCGVPSWSTAQQDAGTASLQQPEGSQFFLLGFIEEGGTRRGILGWQGLVFLVREGDTVLGTYRVERLADDLAILREGDREIRAPFRPKQPQVTTPPPSLPVPVAGGTLPPPVEQVAPALGSQGASASPGGGPAGGTGAGSPPTPRTAIPGSAGSVAQSGDDNPFVRALRERAQQGTPSTPSDNPFVSGEQAGSSGQTPGDNPFLRALRERGSSPTSPQDNPFLRAVRERGY